MKKLISLLLFVISLSFSKAQLLSWTPSFPEENNAATDVVITADATKGNQGLLNYTPVTDVYVHIGVITNLSANATDWQYVKFAWGTTNAQAQCISLTNNQWQYTITGGLRSYFGITNPSEHIQKIAILFRNGDGSKKLANADESDMYVPVYDNTIVSVRFTDPPIQPLYIPQPEPITKAVGDHINLVAVANKTSTMKLYLDGTVIQTANNATTISANPVLSSGGNTVIVAEANDGTTTKTDTIEFFVTGGITVAPLPAGVRDGINYGTDNTAVTLVLYAPLKNRVSVIGEFPGSNWTEQTQYQMNKTPDGVYWWLRITGLTPGTEYAFQYLVDGTLKIADPYAEKILDPYNNNDQSIPSSIYPNLKSYPNGSTTGIVSILQTASPQYNWQVNNFTRPDKRKLVIYELLVRDFLAAHDWNTLRDTLNYLQNLGINAIEIMPFNEFEGNNSWGYNPDFYFAPDKYYGPKNTLQQFIDSCHGRGIAVVMDIALNHSFGLSPLVQLYWDAANSRPAANNPWFNPAPKHAFNVGYDMNHESLATRYFVSRVVEHWLANYKIDGFRFDLSKGFTQTQTCDNNGNNCDVNAWGNYDATRVAIWKRYYDTLQLKSPGCYAILEHFAANTEEIELSNYGMLLWGNMSYNYEQASMGYNTDWDFSGGIYTDRNWTQPNLVTYMESHDEERLTYKNIQFGNSSGTYNIKDVNTALKRVEMCGAFLFTIPGPKMLWQFGELGYDYSINTCTNGSVNDSCRLTPKPIHWDYLQNIQRKRLHDVFAELIKLRSHPLYKDVFTTNDINQNLTGGFKTLQVNTDSSKLCVIGNFDVIPQTANVTFQTTGTWYDYFEGTPFVATGLPQNITLQPGEYHVYLNRNVVSSIVTPVSAINSPGSNLFVRMLPNPVLESAVIDLTVPEAGNMQINLLNIQGQKVCDIYSGFLSKGEHTINFTKKNLPGGVYMLKVNSKISTGAIKIVVK
jgi:1,4-alpha-glucan branching enzyme